MEKEEGGMIKKKKKQFSVAGQLLEVVR